MLFKIASARLVNNPEAVEELVQQTWVHVWEKSMPKFDPTKGVKLSTFVYRCASNFMSSSLKTAARQRGKACSLDSLPARSNHDTAVERAADQIVSNPGRYLTPAQARLLTAVREGGSHAQMALRLGYNNAATLSAELLRLRERVAGLCIEEVASHAD